MIVNYSRIENTVYFADYVLRIRRVICSFLFFQHSRVRVAAETFESDEITRRAERKVKALRYCTMWLALCLISREQNLEMNSIIDSFSSR